MTKTFYLVCFLTAVVSISGCGGSKKSEESAQESVTDSVREIPRLSAKGALLENGYAALMVSFPEPVEEGEWLSLVKVNGAKDTDKLPRIPLASSHSVTILNIPPGLYTVDAKAWVRKSLPYAGGISDTVVLVPGELLMMKANEVMRKDGNFDGIQLKEAGRKSWTLSSPHDLSKYIAEAATKIQS